MRYSAVDLANYILDKCTTECHPISNLQLNKILYYIQKEFLNKFDKPCFEEDFEAWQFGPVILSVYYKYSGFGAIPIKEKCTSLPFFPAEEKQVIDDTICEKRSKGAWELVSDTHEEGKAWSRVYRDGEGYKAIITQGLIRKYG